MSGFFLMHRGWRDNPIFRGEFSRADAWVWMIEHACWKPTRVRIKGETIDLNRGELSYSLRFLADAWGWSKSKVDRFLDALRAESMISTRSKTGTAIAHKAGQGQIIVTICNYRKYQDHIDDCRDNSGTHIGTTAGQQRDKEEQGNKVTIEEEPKGSLSSAAANDVEDRPDFKLDLDEPEPAPKLKPEHVLEAWNEMAKRTGLPVARGLSAERRRNCQARIRDHPIEDFTEAIAAIERSEFLRNGNGTWRGASFDFLIQKSTFLKLIEGQYDQKPATR